MLQFARENPGWGYDRIVGALANLGCHLSIGNILKRHGLGFRYSQEKRRERSRSGTTVAEPQAESPPIIRH